MAEYQVQEFVSGKWAKANELGGVKRAYITNEVKPTQSKFTNEDGTPKMQDVGRIKFDGLDEPLNVNLNRATIGGLVKAFGKDSKNWINQVLSVETEDMRVAGKKVTALYLIPEGFAKVDDENGYAAIVRKVGEGEQPAPDDDIPTINLDDEKEIKLEDVPF